MTSNKKLLLNLVMMIIVAAICRVSGLAPHLAMALFAGAVIRQRVWAFSFPIFSLFLSDVIYHVMYLNGLTPLSGFYEGQVTNYVLVALMVIFGFFMKRVAALPVIGYSLLVCGSFFLLSNFFVWASGSGLSRPFTAAGLLQCYVDALPFLGHSVVTTLLFSGVLFGAWKLINGGEPAAVVLRTKK